MARRKKVTETEEPVKEVVTETEEPVNSSYKIKKLIRNPLKISLSIVLQDFEPYTLSKVQLDDAVFMTHIDKLASLKKIERV